jgi:hypothetical protein
LKAILTGMSTAAPSRLQVVRRIVFASFSGARAALVTFPFCQCLLKDQTTRRVVTYSTLTGMSAHCSLHRPRKLSQAAHFHRRLYWRGPRERVLRSAGRMSSRSIDV